MGTPVIVQNGTSGGYIMFNPKTNLTAVTELEDTLYYATYSSDGSIGEIRKTTGVLSDCQPIMYNQKAVWYTSSINYSQNGTEPSLIFYTLDQNGIDTHKIY